MNEQQLIDDFFSEINDERIINALKLKHGEIKSIKNQQFNENQSNSEFTTFFTPKMEFKSYLEYKDKFKQAKKLLNKVTALAEKNDPKAIHEMSICGSIHKTMIQSALNSWITLGYKNEIESIISTVSQ